LTVVADLSGESGAGKRRGHISSLQIDRVATLEKRQRYFKNPCLTTIEFEFLFTLRRGADLP
jgi:hypothetical protein